MFTRIRPFLVKHQVIIRGMLSYGILWPCGNLLEQSMVEHRSFSNYDWMRCFRFGVFGAFVMAPTLHYWLRFASIMWPKTDLKSAVVKSLTEQVTFDPASNSIFLFGMSLMEGKTFEGAGQHVSKHFFDIYKVGVFYWPCVSALNFLIIPTQHQVVVTAMFSMLWTAFLACF